MAVTIGSVMRHCRNYFEAGYLDGEFDIVNGELLSPAFSDGRFIAIQGSAFNDGVHRQGDGRMIDESFEGRVWVLSPPADFVQLCREIAEYDEKNPAGALQSESFGNYSYTRAGDSSTGGAATWQSAFQRRLAMYQKLTSEVMT